MYGVILCSTEWSLGAGSLAPVEMDGLCVSNSDRFRLCIAGGSFVKETREKRKKKREAYSREEQGRE